MKKDNIKNSNKEIKFGNESVKANRFVGEKRNSYKSDITFFFLYTNAGAQF